LGFGPCKAGGILPVSPVFITGKKFVKEIDMNEANKFITFDEAVAKLGLQPFEEFAKARTKYYPRGTGRTTKMLLSAVVASQTHPVCIKAANHDLEKHFYRMALEMAKTLGLETANILPKEKHSQCKVFVDHFQQF
jgi:hypothetical protein